MIIKITEADINAANDIFDDLSDRCGIGDELGSCDADIQHEIKVMMAEIIAKHMQLERLRGFLWKSICN